MTELELKYGCNPNQKPSKIFMANGKDLPIEVLNGKYRVHDVDCPDKICEKVGWVSSGSPTLIVCLPNNIVLVQV